MNFKERTLAQLADMICGNKDTRDGKFFVYRSSSVLTRFFRDCDTDHVHDGSTRHVWVISVLKKILDEPQASPNVPPDTFSRVISTLMDPSEAEAEAEGSARLGTLAALNNALSREGFEAFYTDQGSCCLRHIATNSIAAPPPNPHRPFSVEETRRRQRLVDFLDSTSEDSLIEEVLLPLFRQLGFHRISAAGHRDKALEYGKDIWMKHTLPTQHVLYFGLQAKRGKLDSAGMSKAGQSNIAEIHNQVLMMLGHEIFDPETSRRVLVDHAFMVAGGEITKAARNWLGGKLDATKRSQVMFMDRDDILNLYIVTNLPLPDSATKSSSSGSDEEIPF